MCSPGGPEELKSVAQGIGQPDLRGQDPEEKEHSSHLLSLEHLLAKVGRLKAGEPHRKEAFEKQAFL